MKTRNLLRVALILLLGATAVLAQEFWVKNEWQKWSESECRKLLEESPWARKWTRGEVREVTIGQPTGGTGRESEPVITYVIQFRSALPVRQAFIRQFQIRNKYDKMSPEEKKKFDASAEAFLNRSYEDVIVIHVLYACNVQMYERELMRIWQSYPSGTVPLEATLINSKNERVAPIKFISPPGGAQEFELIFPRQIDGRPFVNSDVKSLRVEFPHPNVGNMGSARVFEEFKTDKMTVGGQVLY